MNESNFEGLKGGDGSPRHQQLVKARSQSLHSGSVDLVGPFPEARGQARFILVAVDYFSKWIEAEARTTIGAAKVKAFYWRKLVCRFEVPATIISDNGTQFAIRVVRQLCKELGIQQRFSSVEHLQINGKVESAN